VTYLEIKALYFIIFGLAFSLIISVFIYYIIKDKKRFAAIKAKNVKDGIKQDIRHEHDEIIKEKLGV